MAPSPRAAMIADPEAAPAVASIPPPPWWRGPRAILALSILALIAVGALWLAWALPLGRALEPLKEPTLVLVSADGKAFARRGAYKEAPVTVAELPPHVVQAFIAIEDRRFYQHWGIDLRSVARAVRNDVRAGAPAEGGSTITQQLAKNAFLTNERSFRRKAQEALIALYLEIALSKDEILSRYLSSVSFGDGTFGLRAAARRYFNKAPADLTLAEAAMLAGTLKAPSRLAPSVNLAAARRRAKVVLAAMVETGAITATQARRAGNARLRPGRPALPVGSYFADWVMPQARDAFERAYGEVRAQTTLDSALQARAEAILKRALANEGGSAHVTQGALIAIRTNGEVVAMVGGRDYRTSQFNRAVDARRQPGSAFKLFVYLAAFRAGMTPESQVSDTPLTLGDWSPDNYGEQYAGRDISLRQAFARSSNVAAVRISERVGRANVAQAARDLGIRDALPNNPTIALGAGEVTLIELTAAYAAIAAGEAPVIPYGVQTAPPVNRARPLSAAERNGLLSLLREVVASGTGRAAQLGITTYGKTGTSQGYRDAYFVGFVGDLAVGVWLGNDDNTPMARVAGGGLPTRIWKEFMTYALARNAIGGVPREAPAPVTPVLPDESSLDDKSFRDPGLGDKDPTYGPDILDPDQPPSRQPGPYAFPGDGDASLKDDREPFGGTDKDPYNGF